MKSKQLPIPNVFNCYFSMFWMFLHLHFTSFGVRFAGYQTSLAPLLPSLAALDFCPPCCSVSLLCLTGVAVLPSSWLRDLGARIEQHSAKFFMVSCRWAWVDGARITGGSACQVRWTSIEHPKPMPKCCRKRARQVQQPFRHTGALWRWRPDLSTRKCWPLRMRKIRDWPNQHQSLSTILIDFCINHHRYYCKSELAKIPNTWCSMFGFNPLPHTQK